jgi:hypothetical protein
MEDMKLLLDESILRGFDKKSFPAYSQVVLRDVGYADGFAWVDVKRFIQSMRIPDGRLS